MASGENLMRNAISMPGATLHDMLSTSLASIGLVDELLSLLAFLQGCTWNSLESGGTILTDRATLSLFLHVKSYCQSYLNFGSHSETLQNAAGISSYLPQLQDVLFDLERLVVGELDDMWLWLEQRLVYVNLRVSIDAVVSDVEVLDDLRFGKLVDEAPASLLVAN